VVGTLAHGSRAPSKSRFVPFVRELEVVVRRRAAEFVEAGSQVPAAGMFGHLVQTATLTVPVEAELNGVPGSFEGASGSGRGSCSRQPLELHRPPDGGGRTLSRALPGQLIDAVL
jgi:hypothetical protein